MNTEKEYTKIGKAVINEFIERGNETDVTVLLRSVQHNGKLYIVMEDRVEVLSEWGFGNLLAVRTANRARDAKERGDTLLKKIRDAHAPEELPRVVIGK